MAPGQVPHTLAWLQKAAVKGVRASTFSAVLAVHERAEVRPTCGMLPVLHVRLRTTWTRASTVTSRSRLLPRWPLTPPLPSTRAYQHVEIAVNPG